MTDILDKFYRWLMTLSCVSMVSAFVAIMLGVAAREFHWDIQGLDAYAGYAIAAFLPFLFLTFVYPRLPQILGESFHPTDTIMKGNLKGGYAYVTIELMILVSIITNWIYNLRSRAGILELEVENYGHDIQNTRRSTTDTPVVRRISVSDES